MNKYHIKARAVSAKQVALECSSKREGGVGLIEVMIALFILTFGALAIASMQASALSAVRISSSHYEVSSISEEILAHLKADSAGAGSGVYNTTFDETAAAETVSAERGEFINEWKNKVAFTLSDGATQINCDTTECTVSLRWREAVSTGTSQQIYNLKVPL